MKQKVWYRRGVKEIMLIAQELTYYGLDIYKKRMLADLLQAFKLMLKVWNGFVCIMLIHNKFPLEILDVMQ